MNLEPLLIVEDCENDAILLRHALKEAGVLNPLFFAKDCREAIAYFDGTGRFENRASFPLPRVVLLDINLSSGSGFEVLTWIRADERFAAIVVIVLSASSDTKDITQAYSWGANSYLTKPSSRELLVEILRSFRLFWLESNQFPG